MSRFKLMIMTMNRFRLLLVSIFVLAIPALSGVTYAAQEPVAATATQATGQDAAAKQKTAVLAAKARAKRDAVQKQRLDAQKFIRENATGHQPRIDGTAPEKAGGAQ